VAQNTARESEIESLKQAKEQLLKVKGSKPQKIIDKLSNQNEAQIDEISRLKTELAKAKG